MIGKCSLSFFNTVLLFSLLWAGVQNRNKITKRKLFWVPDIYKNRKSQADYYHLLREMKIGH